MVGSSRERVVDHGKVFGCISMICSSVRIQTSGCGSVKSYMSMHKFMCKNYCLSLSTPCRDKCRVIATRFGIFGKRWAGHATRTK